MLRSEQEFRQRRYGRGSTLTVSDRVDEPRLICAHPAEEEIFFGGEVVEKRRFRHLGLSCHLGHGHLVEPALGEQAQGRVGDRLASLRLLAFTQPWFRVHGPSIATTSD